MKRPLRHARAVVAGRRRRHHPKLRHASSARVFVFVSCAPQIDPQIARTQVPHGTRSLAALLGSARGR